jgi:4-hydroxybutyrate dehydrogenase/sulfolactaldehyde 3-reductase
MANIAFFGLGAMGAPIANNLASEGHHLAVFDTNPQACSRISGPHVRIGNNPADTAQGCDFVITLLPTSSELKQVICGPEGAIRASTRNTVFIDMSTGSLADFMELHADITAQEMSLIDSPIARGPEYAAARQNLFLVGGEKSEIDRIYPILAPICEEVVHCGEAGSALKTKIINNYLASVSVVANAEALALASAVGLNRDFLRNLWKRTVAGRGSLETIFPNKAFIGDFTPGFSARLARKDLYLAQELGEKFGVPMTTGTAAIEMFTLQQTKGRIDDDWSALLDILQDMSKKS